MQIFSLYDLLIITMPPLKQIKIPDRILYNKGNTYNMVSCVKTNSCEQGAYLGNIKLTPKKDTLYIADMQSKYPENKELRVGTSLINFAKNISRKLNLGGKLEVIAYNTEYGGKDPHKFYWKQGFRTNNPKTDDLLEFVTDYNLDIPHPLNQGITMYYNPTRECKKSLK